MARFVPRIRKHKVRERLKRQHQAKPVVDANFQEIPESREQAQRRFELHNELRAAQLSTLLSKKKKRLDKFIDSKLRKEENRELIRKLGQQSIDGSILQSSKTLGQRKKSQPFNGSQPLSKHRDANRLEELSETSSEGESASKSSSDLLQHKNDKNDLESSYCSVPEPREDTKKDNSSQIGAGLKRSLELDNDGLPIIPPRNRRKYLKQSVDTLPLGSPNANNCSSPGDSCWEGFSSSSYENSTDHSRDDSTQHSDENKRNDNDENSEDFDGDNHSLAERASAFKAWAMNQRNDASGFKSMAESDTRIYMQSKLPSGEEEQSHSLGGTETLLLHSPAPIAESNRKVFHVPIHRPQDVEMKRQELPVVAKEQEIMETVFTNDICVLTGTTGSGKTTQIPQFLYEAGFGNALSSTPGTIGVTQPRRIAATSMAKRVAYEMGELDRIVSHQIRFDSSVSSETAIKFMTDGILLREVSQDFLLQNYSIILVDEAHERSVNTDILIGMLSRISDMRRDLSNKGKSDIKPLKVVIMSATLRIGELLHNRMLFRRFTPPVIDVEGRQFDVTTHFARKTASDYVEEMFQKVSRGHRKLPSGGMLVFLTGQNDIEYLKRRLKSVFSSTESEQPSARKIKVSAEHDIVELDDVQINNSNDRYTKQGNDVEVDDFDSEEIDCEDEFGLSNEASASSQRIHVLPLYSQLPSDIQARVFDTPPENSRLIILSTNVAETSLTVPNIRYVFDSGRHKSKHYNPRTGVQSIAIDWISKASAQQRAGRAGRTGPGGHCYRLYSSAVFEDAFSEFSEPEITQTPVEGVVLTLKSMGIPDVTKFPFPTPISIPDLRQSERLLQYLGALDSVSSKVTPQGRQLSLYPLSPRLARILVLAHGEPNVLNHAISLVAALGVSQLFIPESSLGLIQAHDYTNPGFDIDPTHLTTDAAAATARERRHQNHRTFHAHLSRLDSQSDAIKHLTTLADFSVNLNHQSGISQATANSSMLHFNTFTRTKTLHEALQLRDQLTSLANVQALHSPLPSPSPSRIPLPTTREIKLLRTFVAAGYIDHVAQRADLALSSSRPSTAFRTATSVPYVPLLGATRAPPHATLDTQTQERLQSVYIHPSSVLARCPSAKLPRFIIYSHLSTSSGQSVAETVAAGEIVPRTRMHPLTPVSAETLVRLAKGTPLLTEGKPVGMVEALERGPEGEERRAAWCVQFLKGEGDVEWALGAARRVVQRRVKNVGWVGE